MLRKMLTKSTEALLLRLQFARLLILGRLDPTLDLPDYSQVHYVLNVCATLRENIMCAGL